MYEAVCPNGHRLQIPVEHAGMKLRCPACNAVFQLNLPREAPAAASNSTSPAPAGAAAGVTTSPVGTSPPAAAAANDAGGRWSGTEAAPAATTAPAPAAPRPATQRLLLLRTGGLGNVEPWLRGLLALGLFLALTAKGCEGLGAKSVVRLQGQVDLEQRRFDDRREEAVLEVQARLDDPKVTSTRRTELQKELDDLNAKFDKERRELQTGPWRLLTNAAARAAAENRGAGYWRELAFVSGTILLALGLLATALVGQGTERWLCFGLLAIILFSVYVGGMAWTASPGGILK